MNTRRLLQLLSRNTFLVSGTLMIVAVLVNYQLQDSLFELRVLSNNMRTLLPLIILAAGQAIVIVGGGIDLSVGTMVSMLMALMLKFTSAEATGPEMILAMLIACGGGMLAGALNGIAVAYLRLQPIVTTYATSFIFSGIALYLLPRPGGAIPHDLMRFYRSSPADIPLGFYVIGVLIVLWILVRSTRYAQFLYAVGSSSEPAYTTGIPVRLVRFSTYVWSGLFAAFSAIALTLSTGSGQANIGDDMTLDSIVAVVLGGTRLSGGQGGIVGAIFGVIILRAIRNIIFFAEVSPWMQTLVNAVIIIAALAAPGLLRLIRKVVSQWTQRALRTPLSASRGA